MACDVSVGGFWYMCVQLHGEPGGGVPKPPLDHPGMLALLDHEAGGDVAEPVEGESQVDASPLDRGVENSLGELAPQRATPGLVKTRSSGPAPGRLSARCPASSSTRKAGTLSVRLEDRLLVSATMRRPSTSAIVWRTLSMRRRKSTSPTRSPAHSDQRRPRAPATRMSARYSPGTASARRSSSSSVSVGDVHGTARPRHGCPGPGSGRAGRRRRRRSGRR